MSAGLRQNIADFKAATGRYPVSSKEAGLPDAAQISNKYVESLNLLPDGSGTMVITMSSQAHRELAGKTLRFIPEAEKDGISWSCRSGTIDQNHLPKFCRY